MNSSQTPHARPAEQRAHVLLVGEGGVPYVASGGRDPMESWVELMEVVEALCVRWPARRQSLHLGSFRL
jgi:hypothetical protein